MSARKRYCQINLCENHNGTENRNTRFFWFVNITLTNATEWNIHQITLLIKRSSMPSKGDIRQIWIESIRTHQKIDCLGIFRYMVCQLHFPSTCINTWNGRSELKKGSVPTIFPFAEQYVVTTYFGCEGHVIYVHTLIHTHFIISNRPSNDENCSIGTQPVACASTLIDPLESIQPIELTESYCVDQSPNGYATKVDGSVRLF